ncbi:MAG TPA: DUF711 family protein, partial [Desulfosporosinus sp.]|nr:DUF711 family protein [Desulfosporosinus sp.]
MTITFAREEIQQTIKMIHEENLDIRTITMGISLLDCGSEDINRLEQKIYDKVVKNAGLLVSVGERISAHYGIPIINKRVSVTPIGIVAANMNTEEMVRIAKALDRAAREVGVNFIGGFSALVQKGFTVGDLA